MGKLVVFDGNAVLHRAYHALPPLKTKSGEPINAVYGMISMLLRVVGEFKPTHVAFTFDRKEPTFRSREFKAYQAQRPPVEDNLASQFGRARDVLTAMKIPFYDKAGYEADDIIGTLAKKSTSFREVVIVTGDRDQFQLVDSRVRVFMPSGGLSGGKLFGEKDVSEKMGVGPNLIVDYKGLVGDASDNYPGVTGIGPKTAIALLEKYGSFTGIYKNLKKVGGRVQEKLEKGRERGEISYKLARIVNDVDFDFAFADMAAWQLASKEAVELFGEYGFRTLTQRVINYQGGVEDVVGKDGLENKKFKKKLTVSEVQQIVLEIAKRLQGHQYAVRGTASMVLQGLDMGVDDIDIVCDKKAVSTINRLFQKELFQKVEYRESDKFKSYFGKADFEGLLVEFYGEWQIKKPTGDWSSVYNASKSETTTIKVKQVTIPVTTLETELKVSSEMGRWNEYHKIKREIEKKSQGSLF